MGLKFCVLAFALFDNKTHEDAWINESGIFLQSKSEAFEVLEHGFYHADAR